MKQIIALGGGGFSMEPENPLLDTYILNQAEASRPKICFLPTASGDAQNYIDRFYQAFEKQNCEPSHLSLFQPHTRNFQTFILDQDIIFVGGGNTRNLLVLWKEWGLDEILHKAYQNGIVLSGISAGSLCWFEEGLTDSYGDELETLVCLGFLEGSNSPHYDGESKRRPSYQNFIHSNQLKPGIAADDGVALHFIDGKLSKAVSSRTEAKAYYVSQHQERELDTIYLGKETC